ncbi:hypothetical protein L1987_15244 [Smallanthus sonchifolius]|uniref:Uncharacterized protein n=1 Tax=Smallanthus sonchifolius TaxID=185202 RepID=A0ACB9J5E9_9ASTR|nr:hypothetical protein L1987_15244 [Smallanthus sonchifolius]
MEFTCLRRRISKFSPKTEVKSTANRSLQSSGQCCHANEVSLRVLDSLEFEDEGDDVHLHVTCDSQLHHLMPFGSTLLLW